MSGRKRRFCLRLSLVLLPVVGHSMFGARAYAQCGGLNEIACCICDNDPTCDAGLFEIAGCDAGVDCETGDCTGGDNCFGFGNSNGYCVALTPCGGEGERACCINEQIPACDSGLIEIGSCKNEHPDGRFGCGCDVLGSISGGMCRKPNCGGVGQRGCCLLERIPSCDAGLIEDISPSCENDPNYSGSCDCEKGLGKSLGVCRPLKGLGDTGCDGITDPGPSNLICLATANGTMCVPLDSDGLFSSDLCAAFYSSAFHQAAITSTHTHTFGSGASISVFGAASVEAGVAYGADGCYGCYFTKCYGGDFDLAIGVTACAGQGFDGQFSSVAGDSCVSTLAASVPGLKIGGSISSGWAGSGVVDCLDDGLPDFAADCFSLGVGVNPWTIALELCNTVTNLVACEDENGELVLTPDEPPILCRGTCDSGLR